jgi:FkbM family methyltransferase
MLLRRIKNFVSRPLEQKLVTIRYFLRWGLSKLPYAPVRTQLLIPPAEKISFWWSYVAPSNHPERQLLDYWGDDVGELRFLWRILKPGMVFIDIGAYHGLYTIVAAKKLGKQGQLLAFEPSQRERRRLRFHLRLNRISTVRLEPYGVGSRSEKVGLFTVISGFTSMNSLRRPAIQAPVKEVLVEIVQLDEYLKQKAIRQIDVIKIDTEGGELEVLSGLQRSLTYRRPLIICEVLDWVTQPWGYRAREIVSCLKQCDYHWFEFRPDGTIFCHEQKDNYPDLRNYLAVPKEKLPTVQDWIRP